MLPLLRSKLQAELLTLVLLSSPREWSLTDLAGRIGTSVSTAQREIQRAELAGVVASRRLGNTRLVQAAESPLTAPLTELLLRAFGPAYVLAEQVLPLAGITEAYVFGSWAARYAGEAGRPPVDIDLLVIGEPDRDALEDAVERAEQKLAREVNVTVRTPQWWADGDDAFHRDVSAKPKVALPLATGPT